MRYILILLSLLITVSCEFDYEIGSDFPPFKPQVVLNSAITPNKPIEISMLWSIHLTPVVQVHRDSVDSFDVKIYEDEKLILDSIGKNGVLKTNIPPKAGSTYSLEVDVLDYGKITAETYIPSKPYKVKIDSIKREIDFWYLHRYQINSIDISEQTRALWIRDIKCHVIDNDDDNDDGNLILGSIHATNPYLDQINAEYDQLHVINATGSGILHKEFLRVPFKNLSKVFPINLAVDAATYNRDPSYYVKFSIITPSDDYDKYYRSEYEQGMYRKRPATPLSYEAVHIYSNIKGGLGIFAGYLEEIETITYPKRSKE